MRADWIVETQFGMGGMSPAVTKRIDALPETGAVTPLRFVNTKVDGAVKIRLGGRPDHGRADHRLRREVGIGDRPHAAATVAVQADEAKARHLQRR